jgi:RES domain-containing protein
MDPTGSRLFPGRWNTPGAPVLYAARHYSLAMLEKLAHGAGRLPPNQHAVCITLPRGLSFEAFDPAALPGWDAPDQRAAQRYGAAWQKSGRSAVLLVPFIIARVEENVLINTEHPEFAQVETALPRPVWWDKRLFR